MAIRPSDFAPGEVLTSSDLNDTFGSKLDYPAGGSDGDLLAKDGTDAEWVAPDPGGLTLITSETFSAVSSVSVDGCFTSAYENYRIVLQGNGSVGTASIFMRLRASGTDDAGTNYQRGVILMTNVSGPTASFASATEAGVGGIGDTVHSADILVTRPQKAAQSTIQAQNVNGTTGFQFVLFGNNHTLSTAHDGFTIIAGSGTISGLVRVYGLGD